VFFQVSRRPLLTVTNRHVIGQALDACGGRNIFADVSGLTATVSVEAVLDAAPEVVLAGGFGPEAPAELEDWRRWAALPAARDGNLFSVDADLVSRPGTRLLDGVAAICAALDEARKRAAQR
jgi:iron complex transport system substrate-binding protein